MKSSSTTRDQSLRVPHGLLNSIGCTVKLELLVFLGARRRRTPDKYSSLGDCIEWTTLYELRRGHTPNSSQKAALYSLT